MVSDKTKLPPPTKMPQLAFTSTQIEPTMNPKASVPFGVEFFFANIGDANTGNFTIRMVFTDKSTLITQTYDIAVPSLTPGTQRYVYWPFPVGLKVGSYVIDAYLDVTNQVQEPDEGPARHQAINSFIVN